MSRELFNILVLLVLTLGFLWIGTYADAGGRSTNENAQNNSWCASMGGKREVRHYYLTDDGDRGFVSVDCETATHVYEGGLDKRSSQDSVHQATFYALQTGKAPGVVIFDTDGIEGKDEYQIREVCEVLGVEYISAPAVW